MAYDGQPDYSNKDKLGTIQDGEYHPAADDAMIWFKTFVMKNAKQYLIIKEAIHSSALSGNRLGEICSATIERLRKGEPVSDRYLLGLCWTIQRLADDRIRQSKTFELKLKVLNAMKYSPDKMYGLTDEYGEGIDKNGKELVDGGETEQTTEPDTKS